MDTGIRISSDIPGGNIIVDDISGNRIKLRQDYENSSRWWFWWNFAIDGAAGRTVVFDFGDKDVFSVLGPCCSDGREWLYLGADVICNNSFNFKFPEGASRYYFAFARPYTRSDLERFLYLNTDIKQEELTVTSKKRAVELISLISKESRWNVLLTARHHACEVSASFVLEGIFEFWQADPWLRKYVDLRAVPFMDTDGVQDGDQGKNRKPHDHNRDYGPFIYPETKALIDTMKEWPRTAAALDLHSPFMKEKNIFAVGAKTGQKQIDKFTAILKENRTGVLHYDGLSDIPYGSGWNVTPQELTMSGFLRENSLADMAVTMEIPYVKNKNIMLTPENLREFGHDIAVSLKIYLQEYCLSA